MLTNLIENAIEHTPASVPIEIAVQVADGQLVAEVADRGPGLPPGAERRVFEKFFRPHAGGEGGHRGIRLGRAIARGVVVEAHGGPIVAGTANGCGGGLPRRAPGRQHR